MLIADCPSKGTDCPDSLLPGRREKTGSPAEFPCCAGIDYYMNDACYLHWHEEFEIVYVVEGALSAHINGTCCRLDSGQGILVNTGVLHSYSESQNVRTKAVYILFLPSLTGGPDGSVYWKKYIRPLTGALSFSCLPLTEKGTWHDEVLRRAEKTASLMEHEDDGFEIDVRSELTHILRLVSAHTAAPGPVSARQSADEQAMRAMLSFMENNCGRDLRIEEIAASAYMSPQSCLRLFRRFTSMPPKRYLLQVRLEKARRLLLESTLNLGSVCAECGFSDQSYFTKLFREHFGMPPGAFRHAAQASG